jgi:cell division protein FtsB
VTVSLTLTGHVNRVREGEAHVKDIYEVLRKKQGQLAQLGKQIEALQQAAEQLRSVAHLLESEEDEGMGASAGRG